MKTKKYNIANALKLASGFGLVVLLISASAPTSGDYAKTFTQIQVNNSAQESLRTVNEILCILSNTNYSHFIGQGPILAQVDQNVCATNGNPGQQSSNSTAGVTPNYLNIVFDAPSAASGQPQTAKIWVTGNVGGGGGSNGGGGEMSMEIDATLSVSQTPTTDNPYGLFNFSFSGYPVMNGQKSPVALMKGYVSSTINANKQNQLEFVQSEPGMDPSNSQLSQVILIGNGLTNGFGRISMPNMMNGPQGAVEALAVAYNNDSLLQQTTDGGSSNQICYDRNNPINVIYQYGVFNNDGSSLVVPHSGYQVIYNNQNGYLSYYGLGFPSNISPTNGSSIQYFTDFNSPPASGTLIVKSGKFSQLAVKQYSLSQLGGLQISIPNMNNQQDPQTMTNDIIKWNASTQSFNKVGTQSCSMQDGCTTASLPSPVAYSQSDFLKVVQVSGGGMNQDDADRNGNVNFWINGLGAGGNTQLQLFSGCSVTFGEDGPVASCSTYNTPTNSTKLAIWQNSLVAPVESPTASITYYCITQCPYQQDGNWQFGNPLFDQTGGDNGDGGFYNYIKYSFDPKNYTLVGMSGVADGQEIAVENSGDSQQQVMSGPLLTLAQYNLISDNNTKVPDMSLLFSGDTIQSYGLWQSGGSFNSYTGIKDGNGAPLTLSAPLQLTYTNPTTGDSLFLQYGGIGNLQGIPGGCVDANESPVSQNMCGQPGYSWLPAYNLANGSMLDTIDGSDNIYWVKALFGAQILRTGSNCGSLSSDLNTAKTLTMPTLDGFTPINNGAVPSVSKISVINGVIQ